MFNCLKLFDVKQDIFGQKCIHQLERCFSSEKLLCLDFPRAPDCLQREKAKILKLGRLPPLDTFHQTGLFCFKAIEFVMKSKNEEC